MITISFTPLFNFHSLQSCFSLSLTHLTFHSVPYITITHFLNNYLKWNPNTTLFLVFHLKFFFISFIFENVFPRSKHLFTFYMKKESPRKTIKKKKEYQRSKWDDFNKVKVTFIFKQFSLHIVHFTNNATRHGLNPDLVTSSPLTKWFISLPKTQGRSQ